MEHRLRFQARLAEQRGHGSGLLRTLEFAEPELRDLMAEAIEPPTLLHGDLWSGNYMVDEKGQPVLIDPAVYYGHREADLAMTLWFGGFDADFYAAYDEALPLAAGWRERCEIYRLYHVLNHLNLFGSAYYGQAMSILAPYSAR
jgi:fructosamine-3-kinase